MVAPGGVKIQRANPFIVSSEEGQGIDILGWPVSPSPIWVLIIENHSQKIPVSAAHPILALYSHHLGWLQAWLRRRLGCVDDAADLAQDTFVRLLGRPAQALEPEVLREPRAYLTIVARGLLVDFWRRGELERAYLEDLAHQPEALQPSPEERLAAVQMLEAVDALLRSLTPRTRQAWLMSRLDGLTHAEIAERLQVSVPRVRQYLANALRHAYRMRFGAGQ